MSANGRRRIDRDTAEHLLDGRFGGSLTGADPLAELLAAAAGPARDGELAGEQIALTAFREAPSHHVSPPRRGSMIKPLLVKVLTTKVAVAAAAATALGGGVVAAASTGNLPIGHGGAHGGQSSDSGSSGPSHGPSDRPTSAQTHGTADPSPSMVGLCHAYTAGVADSNGKALDNPAFSVLISKAGGQDKVAGYCATVLAGEPGNAPSTHPTGHPTGEHAHPTAHPTGQPTAHPTGEPTHPTGAPGDHGSPTAHPTH